MREHPCLISRAVGMDQSDHGGMLLRKARVYRRYPTDRQEQKVSQWVGGVRHL